jgi:hypothetical protein
MSAPIVHMTAASSGEIAACLVRVPTEVIKQRMQTNQYNSVVSAVTNIFRQEGAFGFYRGYLTTVIRDVSTYVYFLSKRLTGSFRFHSLVFNSLSTNT